MKKPPTPEQIIEGKEPNELTDLLEMEAPKDCKCKEMSCPRDCTRKHTHKTFSCDVCGPLESSVEKAWEDLKEATENYNKEALKAMDEITLPPLYCDNCGVDVRMFPHKNCIREMPKENINKTSQSVVIGEKITTKEILSRQDLTTPYLVGFKEGKEEARQEILSMIEELRLPFNGCELYDHDRAYLNALTDLSHRIEERYKSE